jgi:hypothetical protein
MVKAMLDLIRHISANLASKVNLAKIALASLAVKDLEQLVKALANLTNQSKSLVYNAYSETAKIVLTDVVIKDAVYSLIVALTNSTDDNSDNSDDSDDSNDSDDVSNVDDSDDSNDSGNSNSTSYSFYTACASSSSQDLIEIEDFSKVRVNYNQVQAFLSDYNLLDLLEESNSSNYFIRSYLRNVIKLRTLPYRKGQS